MAKKKTTKPTAPPPAAWNVTGSEPGTPPEVGTVYNVRHSRKGSFRGRVKSVSGEFANVEILSGHAAALSPDNAKSEGEIVSVRDSLAIFDPIKEQAK